MSELVLVAPPLAAGLLLGVLFFGGLWWTVSRGVVSPQPALWFLGSMLVRMSVTMAGFYAVGRGDWKRWVLCLIGCMVARLIVKWLICPRIKRSASRAPEARYAP
jgi:F1F0 ATPase subunit 2